MKAQTKALIASVVVVALALSAVSGITYSWWSDSESTDITVTTGYVDVETSDFKITKGGAEVSGVTGSIPESFSIVYGDNQDNDDSYWTSGSDAELTINGDPSEEIVITYEATFSWSVAAKYMMGFGSSSGELRTKTAMTITSDSGIEAVANQWVQANNISGEAGFSVTVTISGLPQNLSGADLIINNYITQSKNPVNIWDGSVAQDVQPTADDSNVYEISTPAELAWVAQTVNDDPNALSGKTVKLMNDIDLNGIQWTPIGCYTNGQNFRGTFDGQGHTIYGLNAVSTVTDGQQAAGLFGWAGENSGMDSATIKNVVLVGARVSGHHYVGGIVGYLQMGSIENCEVRDSVLVNSYHGGEADGAKTGGIVGFMASNTSNVSVTGCTVHDVSLTGVRDIGCIAGNGYNDNIFTNNTVSGVNTVTADRTAVQCGDEHEDFNLGKIVGKTMVPDGTNTVKGTVSFSAKVNDSDCFNKALSEGISTVYVAPVGSNGMYTFTNQGQIALETIDILLLGDVTFQADSGTQWTNAFGGSSTKAITFDGQDAYTLTLNHPDSDANHVATKGAGLILKDLKLSNSGCNDGPWNRHDIVFDCEVELRNVVSDKAIALGGNAKFDNVTITDKGEIYALWIKANVEEVELEGLTIENDYYRTSVENGVTKHHYGRAIAIKDEYVAEGERVNVNLTISDSVIKSKAKAAILVTNSAGATITASNVDITDTVDSTNLVWKDNRTSEKVGEVSVPWSCGEVTVYGCTAIVEP